MVLRQISSLGVKAQAIIAGTSYAFWDILLPTIDEAVALTKKKKNTRKQRVLLQDLIYGAAADHGINIWGP